MKIGITADLHLTTKEKHPERRNALLDILKQCKQQDVDQLIIAGDLFDASLPNHAEFEAICKSSEYSKIQLFIIPGNHDPSISNKQIVANNVHIFDQPTCEKLPDNWEICFIPYREAQTMGKSIDEIKGRDSARKWVMVGHGDWISSLSAPNLYEEAKIYMPLTRKEVDLYKPDYVFLGHIHVPQKTGNIFYTGSPCPMDVTEIGYRHYLVLDTVSGNVDQVRVNSDVVYFLAKLVIMPVDDEQNLVSSQIEQCKRNWVINESDLERIRVRVEAVGYSNDRSALLPAIEKGFSGFHFVDNPDISGVNTANDLDRNSIISKFQDELDQVDYDFSREGEPDKDSILLKAMELIYGRG
jgi:DNA repair exonuclease SbcCD nuclease subunit